MTDNAGLLADVRLTRDEKKAQTRQRLLDAAWAVFTERGFLAPTLDDIAEAAGLTKGAVYSNFAGKEDLVLAVLEGHAITQILDNVKGVDFDASADEQASLAGERFMATYEQQSLLFWLEFTLFAARNPELSARFGAVQREIRETVAEIIERTSREFGATLPLSPSHLAIMFDVFATGLALARLHDPDIPPELYGELIRLVYSAGDQMESGTEPS